MLEALAFKAPARGSLTDEEWTALGVGMLDAVGMLRDARSRAVLHAAFESKSLSPALRFAAARAVGKLGGDADLALLTQHASKSDPLELYAIHGLGELRRPESAKHLAARLETTKDDKTAQAIAEALGRVGSSWAWKAMGPNASTAGLETRKICAKALAPRFVKSQGKLRTTSREAILMLEHPESVALLRALRPASGPTAQAVDSLVATIEKQLQRR
jgi:hypothetical protein